MIVKKWAAIIVLCLLKLLYSLVLLLINLFLVRDICSLYIQSCTTYLNNMNQGDNRNGNMPDQQQQSSSQWTQVIGQVIEKLTGTNMSTTISFANLEVDVPRAQAPGGRDLGSAKWIVNGKILWTTEAHKAADSQ
jgi:predicted PurR-regulated permease PerM